MTRFVVTVIVLGALAAASWFMLPVWGVAIAGSKHLSQKELAKMAGAMPGSPWLWVNGWRTRDLQENPWIVKAEVIKHFPGRVEIRVTEREPFAVYAAPNSEKVVVARDGVVLPNSNHIPKLEISGWGEPRLTESLQVAAILGADGLERVEFSPQGFTVFTNRGQIWTDSYKSLLRYGKSVKITQGSRVSVYPWGVSAQP